MLVRRPRRVRAGDAKPSCGGDTLRGCVTAWPVVTCRGRWAGLRGQLTCCHRTRPAASRSGDDRAIGRHRRRVVGIEQRVASAPVRCVGRASRAGSGSHRRSQRRRGDERRRVSPDGESRVARPPSSIAQHVVGGRLAGRLGSRTDSGVRRAPRRGARQSNCAAPSWSSARPAPRRWRGTSPTAARGRPRRRRRQRRSSQRLASSRSASEPPGAGSTTSSTSSPSGSASSRSACDPAGVDDLGEPDLEVLRLAGRPGRRGAGVRDPRVRVEARGVRHRDPGPEHRPLEGPAEVAVAGEPQPAALGVADPQPLDRRGLLLGLVSHRARHARPDRRLQRRASSQRAGRR